MRGVPASPGVCIGKAFLLDSEEITIPRRHITPEEIPQEIARFEEALIRTRQEVLEIQRRIAQELDVQHAEIFNAHLLVLEDRALIEEVVARLKADQLTVECIFFDVLKRYVRAFSRVEDEYLRERTSDVEDVGKRVLRQLLGHQRRSLADLREPVIVIAYDLSPSDTATMHREHVIGFATDIGGRTSHTAIMAKSLEIPAVVGLEDVTQRVKSDGWLIVDGTTGVVIVNPDEATRKTYEDLRARLQALDQTLLQLKDLPAETQDGRRVTLAANIEMPNEVSSVIAHGGEGIGLYRTEFFYLNRADLPTEDEQFEAYRTVAQAVAPHPVVIRTLDLGGDKFASSLKMPHEMNPFLGWRAVRFCLARPDIFKVQLRAILRASTYGAVKMMYPLISGVEEVRQANQLLEEAKEELRTHGIPYNAEMEVGAMIEVPSAALTCDILAKEVQFFSIGTNDLIQYALAVDRVNEKIAYLYEPAHPAVLRLVKMIVDAGHAANLWVGMCGEMAGEPAMTLLLLGLGLDEFSTSPVNIPKVKQVVRSVSMPQVRQLAQQALALNTAKEVEEFATAQMLALVKELT
ncbi:MAG: phosphoenolpyruvate--protein phosphotransferase [Omnitrophica WOR_2 bacterium RIFCSPHIGHO2_02_FULL_68_15]|nr:MAG: phosphoenolpyruvate--protein phosphotransferase [Omnitrophica WOR_2 bacterium RIFCSPHIGHO2_02_FULL_68_15]